MKFTQKWKNFWQIQKHTTGGFTLVELIVVIAILAILAGIAVPAYSGYIDKANEAADQQLLAAINTAFAAACIDNTNDVYNIDSADFDIDTMSVTAVESLNADAVKAYDDAFQKYFAGNEDNTFNVYENIFFSPVIHAFVKDEPVTFTYNGTEITVSASQLAALQNSTYGKVIGASTLLSQIDMVSGIAKYSIGNNATFYDVIYDDEGNLREEYFTALAGQLGMKVEELAAHMGTMTEEEQESFFANSFILSAANSTASMTTEDALGKLGENPSEFISSVKADLSNPETAQSALSDAALIYGVYTSYVYATDPENAESKLSTVNGAAGLTTAMSELQGEKFEKYMEEQGQADLEAYLEAMKVIDNTAQNTDAALAILGSGYTDAELVELLQGALGK